MPNDLSKQAIGLQKVDLGGVLDDIRIMGELKTTVLELFDRNPMLVEKVHESIMQLRPCMSDLMVAWDESPKSSLSLTSIAIGHANVK